MTFRQSGSTSLEGTEAVQTRASATQVPTRLSRRARWLKVKVIEAATAAALETAIQAWFDGATEEEYIETYSISPVHGPASAATALTYTVIIIYTI